MKTTALNLLLGNRATFRVLAALWIGAAIALGSNTSFAHSTDALGEWRRIPPYAHSTLVGEWDLDAPGLRPGFCTVRVIATPDYQMLAQDCQLSTGCCNGILGLILMPLRTGLYLEPKYAKRYELLRDGRLKVSNFDGTKAKYLHRTAAENSLAKSMWDGAEFK